MKEITRIHIAKVPYDIEVAARKKLEEYMALLETYAAETDVYDEIEIRVTELLAERGVARDGVISDEDVHSIREQLGEPEEFADQDGDIATGAVSPDSAQRRLYRNQDQAVLGGVLAGIATYFSVNPLWTRLIFILLLVISFGMAALIYVVLWIAVPVARTAAEKLQLEGKLVTLQAIRELNEVTEKQAENKTPAIMQRTFLVIGGIASLAGGLTALTVTAAGSVLLRSEMATLSADEVMRFGGTFTTATWSLAVLSGLLLTTLFLLLAYALFARKFTKRIIVSGVVIVALGLLAFGSAIGLAAYGQHEYTQSVQRLVKTTNKTLPADFGGAKKLSASAHSGPGASGAVQEFAIHYIVTTGTPRYTLESLPDIDPVVTMNGDTMRIVLKSSRLQQRGYGVVTPRLTIYGPALDEVAVEQGELSYDVPPHQSQAQLVVSAAPATRVLLYGTYDAVEARGEGSVDAEASTITRLTVDKAEVRAGVVQALEVTQPQSCAVQYDDDRGVNVAGVSSGTMTYNGAKMNATSQQSLCGAVQIGDDEDEL